MANTAAAAIKPICNVLGVSCASRKTCTVLLVPDLDLWQPEQVRSMLSSTGLARAEWRWTVEVGGGGGGGRVKQEVDKELEA